MHTRLIGLGLAALLAGLGCGCGGGSESRESGAAPDAPASWIEQLPQLPELGSNYGKPAVGLRGTSEYTYELEGHQYWLKHDHAYPDYDEHELTLISQTGDLSWAIYRFEDVAWIDTPLAVGVDLKEPVPQSIWLGWADYTTGSWRFPKAATLQEGYARSAITTGHLPISPEGAVYLIAVAWDGQSATITSAELELLRTEPPVPENVIATDGTIRNAVNISWDPVEGAQQYEIYRGPREARESQTVVLHATQWLDTSVTPLEYYEYWVRAIRDCRHSDYSESDLGYAAKYHWYTLDEPIAAELNIKGAMLNDLPIVAFVSGRGAFFAGTDEQHPTSFSQWYVTGVDPDDHVGTVALSVTLVSGRPAICYQSWYSKGPRYLRGSSAVPDSIEEWPSISLQNDSYCDAIHLLEIDGRPLVFYARDSEYRQWTVAQGRKAEPGGETFWIRHELVPTGDAAFSAAVVNETPVICYSASDALWYARATSMEPRDSEDWIAHMVMIDIPGEVIDVAEVYGKPWIVYAAASYPSDTLWVNVSTKEQPEDSGDWLKYGIAQLSKVDRIDIALIDGFPAIGISANGKLIVMQAVVMEPACSEDWSIEKLGYGTHISLLDGAECPIVLFRSKGLDQYSRNPAVMLIE